MARAGPGVRRWLDLCEIGHREQRFDAMGPYYYEKIQLQDYIDLLKRTKRGYAQKH
jgi:hypothetical protein